MRILLRKVTKTPLDFEVKSGNIEFKGFLQYHSGKLILLKANITGSVDTECYLCSEEFTLPVKEDIEFYIHDGVYEDSGSSLLDIVESLDSQADLNELLNSEIELIKSDYNSCDKCKES